MKRVGSPRRNDLRVGHDGGVARLKPGQPIAGGRYEDLPTAGEAFHGAIATTADGAWVCQPDGSGGYVWIKIGGGGGGLSLVAAPTTFSASSSITLDGVFTSAYRNYYLVIDITDSSVDAGVGFQLRASGSNVTTSYDWYDNEIDSINGHGFDGAQNTSSWVLTSWGIDSAQTKLVTDMTVFNPFVAEKTAAHWTSVGYGISGGNQSGGSDGGGLHRTASAYDGFRIFDFLGSGTLTGSIRVYGLGDTVAASAMTTEALQDLIAAMMSDTATVTWSYDDGAGTLEATAPAAAVSGDASLADVLMLGGM